MSTTDEKLAVFKTKFDSLQDRYKKKLIDFRDAINEFTEAIREAYNLTVKVGRKWVNLQSNRITVIRIDPNSGYFEYVTHKHKYNANILDINSPIEDVVYYRYL